MSTKRITTATTLLNTSATIAATFGAKNYPSET